MAKLVYKTGEEGREHIFEGGNTSIGGGATGSFVSKNETGQNPLLFYALVGLSIYYIGF